MTGLPSGTVLLDDGTGTYPTDITTRVRVNEGVTVSGYGARVDEFSTAQAATLSLVLDNADGLLSVGAAAVGFDVGAFDTSPFGGAAGAGIATPGQRVRYTLTSGATTEIRFTGRITALDLGWPGGSSTDSTVQLTAADVLADLSRKILRSMLEEEVLLRSPAAYYTLSEAENSTAAGDSSGNQVASLTPTGSGSPVTFGSGTGPGTDGISAATFAGGQWLAPSDVGVAHDAFATFGCWFTCPTPPADRTTLLLTDAVALYIDGASRRLDVQTIAGVEATFVGGVITDGALHNVFVVVAGSDTLVYLDGALVLTLTGSSRIPAALYGVGGGARFSWVNSYPAHAGSISHVTTFASGLTAAQISTIYTVGTGITESVHNRVQRFVSYTGVQVTQVSMTNDPIGTGPGVLMAAQSTSGKTAIDALQECATAEGGTLYANPGGDLTLLGRGYRAAKTTPDITLTATEVGEDTTVGYDMAQVVNQAGVTGSTGAALGPVKNTSSIASYGLYPTSLDIPVAYDAEALAAAQWLVASHANPGVRLGSMTLNVHESALAASILARDVGDRIALSTMPAQMWAGAGDVILEGFSDTVTDTSWTITANVLPWSLFASLILDDATYGALDGSYPLGN